MEIPAGDLTLYGSFELPEPASGIVLFVHGSGSSRHSPRNQMVAGQLRQAGLGTLLFDLLTPEEERLDSITREFRFDIPRLAQRLVDVTDWLVESQVVKQPVAYFGSSTGAAAALIASTVTPHAICAIISRGGRPDLAGNALGAVRAPTLLIVGGRDLQVMELNRAALERIVCEKQLYVVPGATHLFTEPGALEEVADVARKWVVQHLS